MVVTSYKTCPKCASRGYRFRTRRSPPPDPATRRPAAVETKYQCAACGHVSKVQLVVGRPGSPVGVVLDVVAPASGPPAPPPS